MLHLPPNVDWDAKLVSECVAARGIPASVHGETVVVIIPEGPPQGMLQRVARWFRPPFHMTISHNASRFIHNVDLSYDVLRMPLDCPAFNDIWEGMDDYGCMTTDARDIASHYMPGSTEIPDLIDKMEKIQLEKEEMVRLQDFDSAARLRDDGELLRVRIDDILRSHLGLATQNSECG